MSHDYPAASPRATPQNVEKLAPLPPLHPTRHQTCSSHSRTGPHAQAHTIKLTERFFCRPQDICDALLDGARIMHFSRSPASCKPEPGPFTMFDGNIQAGSRVLSAERIVQPVSRLGATAPVCYSLLYIDTWQTGAERRFDTPDVANIFRLCLVDFVAFRVFSHVQLLCHTSPFGDVGNMVT